MSEHAPTPWRIAGKGTIRAGDGWVGTVHWHKREANAAFIVKAVNAHEALVKALGTMLDEYDRNVCEHEITHRGGHIWTICEGCGQKWADDEGGFKPHCDPEGVVEARAAIALAKGE